MGKGRLRAQNGTDAAGDGMSRLVTKSALLLACALAVGGCSVPKMLQEPFEQGVYEDIMERQAEGVPIEEEKLKELPALSSADYERLGDSYLTRGQMGLARAKYEKALALDPRSWRLEYKIGVILLRQNAAAEAYPYFQSMVARDPNNSRGFEGAGR